MKVAPGIPHDLVPDGVEAEWVSDHGEVKEAALWSGRLATVAPPRHGDRRRRPGHADRRGRPRAPTSCPLGRFLYEPDGAVIRAGLVTAVAAGVGGGLLDEHIAYVTSDASFRTPFARGYEVLEELPYREKPLRAALRERGIGRLTIKKRGVDVVPDQLRKRLALQGDEEADARADPGRRRGHLPAGPARSELSAPGSRWGRRPLEHVTIVVDAPGRPRGRARPRLSRRRPDGHASAPGHARPSSQPAQHGGAARPRWWCRRRGRCARPCRRAARTASPGSTP